MGGCCVLLNWAQEVERKQLGLTFCLPNFAANPDVCRDASRGVGLMFRPSLCK